MKTQIKKVMKQLTILLLAVLFATTASAQMKTLISGEFETGGYGGPLTMVGQMNGKTTWFLGGQGGILLDHHLLLGGKGYASMKPVPASGLDNIVTGFAAGGVFAEYIILPSNLINFSVESMVGYGIAYNDVGDYYQTHDPIDYTGDGCLVIEPGVGVNLNLSKMVRLSLGVNYRYVNGLSYDPGAPYQSASESNYDILDDKSLTGITGRFSLKIGLF